MSSSTLILHLEQLKHLIKLKHLLLLMLDLRAQLAVRCHLLVDPFEEVLSCVFLQLLVVQRHSQRLYHLKERDRRVFWHHLLYQIYFECFQIHLRHCLLRWFELLVHLQPVVLHIAEEIRLLEVLDDVLLFLFDLTKFNIDLWLIHFNPKDIPIFDLIKLFKIQFEC